MRISQDAFDLIVREEVSSKQMYERKYTHFEWPGGASGPTVGIGHDLGYSSRADVVKDWQGIVDAKTISALQVAAGIRGEQARDWVRRHARSVTIPWDAAIRQFRERELPRWEARALRLPNAFELPPDALGALVSLAYNRGESWWTPASRDPHGRYREMRRILQHMQNKDFDKIPDEFRGMKRLWPSLPGLIKRREREAQLFENGLRQNVTNPTGIV